MDAAPFSEAVASELASRIPLPGIDEGAAHLAHALQMTGIAMCLAKNLSLDQCQCFIDLSLAETKQYAKAAMAGALDDWASQQSRTINAWA